MSEALDPTRKYVAGFMFNESFENVLLILKKRPRWQFGLMNGIGGMIEDNETEMDAIRREFREETGIDHQPWRLFCTLKDERGWSVYFYFAVGNIKAAKMMTDESLVIFPLDRLPRTNSGVITNLRWLIPMALNMKNETISRFEVYEYA